MDNTNILFNFLGGSTKIRKEKEEEEGQKGN